jgi:hypothetical protein
VYGASLRRLAPNLYGVRAGYRHGRHGDRWTFGAVVKIRGTVAFISLASGRGSFKSNYRCQRAVLRSIKDRLGIRRAWWIRDPRSGAVTSRNL